MNIPPGTTGLDGEASVTAIIAELTLDERIAFLHQYQPAVARLGLAAFHTGCEALHGVAWLGVATVFPQAVGLGASWDRDLISRVGRAVSTEVRAFRQDPAGVRGATPRGAHRIVSLNVWAPVVNPLRDPRWGRNEEGLSEDPYAVGELATAYCRGLRGEHPVFWRTAPTLKHFLAYNAEMDRAVADIAVPARTLHEYELPGYRSPIEAGVVAGLMPGYNLTNGVPNHVHPYLHRYVRAWCPDIAIMGDAYAVTHLVRKVKAFTSHAMAYAAALAAGLDSFTENNTDPVPTIGEITDALSQGLITEEQIEAAVSRVLLLRWRTGEFSPDADPYADIRGDVVACEAHARLALEAARAGIVLLKNDSNALPLSPSDRTAVIGHLGTRVLTDWYSGELPYAVTLDEGLRAVIADPDAVITADGTDIVRLSAGGMPLGEFRHLNWGANAHSPHDKHTLQSTEDDLYLSLSDTEAEVRASASTPDGWVVKELWEFHQIPNRPGSFALRASSDPSQEPKFVQLCEDGVLRAAADSLAQAAECTLEVVRSGVAEAAAAAASADRAVVVVGNDPHINGRETIDRADLELPTHQQALLEAVYAANPEVVLVVVSSYPYAIDWAVRHIPAILWTSHAGQESGNALAAVLTGSHNPAGRLPQTWYAASARLPDRFDYDIIGSRWTYMYSNLDHLFEFGHGLSYTEFEYSMPSVILLEDRIVVSTTVRNAGARDGDEVVQLYSHAVASAEPTPLRKLRGFERIALAAGQARDVEFTVHRDELAQWDEGCATFAQPATEFEFILGGHTVRVATPAKH